MDNLSNLSSMTDEKLKSLIRDLVEEEKDLSYKRRMLQGKVDILRAELVQRLSGKRDLGESLISADDVSKLSDILAHREPFHPSGSPDRE